ncbi:O-antigen ligase family protein [Paenarthrobacter sp. NPDC091711]|uniref:O-antigen ligase family protein n=1 Tax=Paenarthrobacter sp. NPDC091711 TaxID=3364385 RepID=UPI003807343E
MIWVILGGFFTLFMAVALTLGMVPAALMTAAIFLVVILTLRPSLSVYLAMILGLTAFPAFIPYRAQLGSTTIFLFEPFLAVAAVWALATHKAPWVAKRRPIWIGLLIVAWALAGLFQKHPTIEVIGDSRGLLSVVLAVIVASRLYGSPHGKTALKVLLVSLWVSLVVTLAAAALHFPIAGRSEATALFLNSSGAGSSESTRFLTAASEISVLVAAASLALMISGRVPIRLALPYLIPSLTIVFLGFSRNSFVALGVTLVFAVLAARTMKPVAVAVKVAVFAGFPILILSLAHMSFGIPGGDFVVTQIEGFMSRVVGGLDASTISDDTSAIARMNEDAYLMQGISQSPFYGHGFGYAYRLPVGPPGSFSATKGQYYGHNFYLWLTVKTGLVGMAIFVGVFILPVLRSLRGGSNAVIGLGAAAAGLLTSMVFAPFPNDVSNGGSLSVGLLFGALFAALSADKPAKAEIEPNLKRLNLPPTYKHLVKSKL